MPVLHDHQALTDSELQNRHSKAFHDGQQVSKIVGMHWHLGFPDDVTGEKCPMRDEATSDLPLFACASATVSFESHEASALQLMLYVSAEYFFALVAIPNAEHLHADRKPRSLLNEVPLSAVTGVCLV